MSNNIEALNTQNKLAVDGALEKLESGNADFISNDEAKALMAKRKGEVREKAMTKSLEALVADMKAAAKLSKELSGISGYRKATESNARFKQLAMEENVLKLIATLEQSQQEKAELVNFYENSLCLLLPDCRYMDPPDGGNVSPIEQVKRMVADYQQRIAELEAAAVKPDAMREVAPLCVKLPMPYDINVAGERVDWAKGDNFDRDEVIDAIRAAGGTVEGE